MWIPLDHPLILEALNWVCVLVGFFMLVFDPYGDFAARVREWAEHQ